VVDEGHTATGVHVKGWAPAPGRGRLAQEIAGAVSQLEAKGPRREIGIYVVHRGALHR